MFRFWPDCLCPTCEYGYCAPGGIASKYMLPLVILAVAAHLLSLVIFIRGLLGGAIYWELCFFKLRQCRDYYREITVHIQLYIIRFRHGKYYSSDIYRKSKIPNQEIFGPLTTSQDNSANFVLAAPQMFSKQTQIYFLVRQVFWTSHKQYQS